MIALYLLIGLSIGIYIIELMAFITNLHMGYITTKKEFRDAIIPGSLIRELLKEYRQLK